MNETYVWAGFITLVVVLMAIDLGVFNRKAHAPTAREALVGTFMWVSLALLFNVFIYFAYENKWFGLGLYAYEPMGGWEASMKYLTGYLLEESLSMDNLFVMALVFAQFRVPKKYQHRILFWGILGVLVFRGILIGGGISLLHYFTWLFYFFGALLLWSSYKLWRSGEAVGEVSDHGVVRLIRRFVPVTRNYHEGQFFTIENGRRAVTPMFIALMSSKRRISCSRSIRYPPFFPSPPTRFWYFLPTFLPSSACDPCFSFCPICSTGSCT